MERAEVNLRELEREMTKLRVEQETAAQAGESEMKIRMKKEERSRRRMRWKASLRIAPTRFAVFSGRQCL